ncbi:hypothetical protein [Microbulbifer spongiae]|uniref:Uncharacterized protein n=1 Tax=Microbulbifer spongiae TaxID=2944933 RepID=A0ABY9EFU7_9GAMM|nr:hypothetical protein [Microbulbifer sp. MI-G]WKD50479.1 hypothetical protein M8T91_03315 [Microbulbifer sp. MI-G]
MKIYQVFENDSDYMTPYFEPGEVIGKRGSIQFVFNTNPQAYAGDWVPLELSLKACDSSPVIPTLSTWQNYLVLHESAYQALKGLLGPFGELLPCTYQGVKFYLFNPLTIAEDLDAIVPSSVTRDNDLLSGIAFDEEKLKDVPVFRTKESYISIYCTGAFKDVVESEKLDGLLFSTNLTHY